MQYQYEHQEFLRILSIVNAKDSLNENNIIEEIKKELDRRTSGIYQKWQKNEFNIDYTHGGQFMLLHVAASNLVKVTELLTNIGADVNVVTKAEGLTPLHIAAEKGHIKIVNALIKKSANVNAENKEGVTPLLLAAVNGHAEIVNALLEKGADPLLGSRNFKFLKPLVESIKLDGPEKVEETQRKKEQVDDEYELLKFSFLSCDNRPLIDVIGRETFDNLICMWLVDVSDLTPGQKKLNGKLLNILKDFPYCNNEDRYSYTQELENFLRENEGNNDLKKILNLRRGESKSTVLHLLAGMVNHTNSLDGNACMNLLKWAGADINIQDDRGKTPQDIIIDSGCYLINECCLTDEQRNLWEELTNLTDLAKLKELLDKHKDN